jgi:hypothetical protein
VRSLLRLAEAACIVVAAVVVFGGLATNGLLVAAGTAREWWHG